MLRFLRALSAVLLLAGGAYAQSNDFSDDITTGGTSQQAIDNNPAGHIVFIQNPTVETETLWVNFGAAAAASVANTTNGESVALTPGGSISIRTTQAVNVVASDTGHVYIAKVLSQAGMDNPGALTSAGGGGDSGDPATADRESFARTADTNAYAAGDVIGTATGSTAAITLTDLRPDAGEIMITSVALEVDRTDVPAGATTFRLHLYNVTPPSALGDNAAWDLPSGDRTAYLGYLELGAPVDMGSTLYVQSQGINKQVTVGASGDVFGYLQTIGGFTPGSATVYVTTVHAVPL